MIKKIGIGASYDDSGPLEKLCESINNEAHKERKESGITNHYFKRSGQDPRTSKFCYQIAGVPLIAYQLMNSLASGAERIAVVGDELVGKVVNHFDAFFRLDWPKITFVPEGNSWSLKNTFEKIQQGLDAKPDEPIVQVSGDTPLFLDINALLTENQADYYDLILDLNCKEKIYPVQLSKNRCYFNRRWHLPIRAEDGTNWVKEPNCSIWKPNENFFSKINLIFEGRKSYRNAGNDAKPKGRSKLIRNLLIEDGKWRKTLWYAPLALSYLGIRRLTSFNPAIIDCNVLSRLASHALDAKVLVKAKHNEWGRLADIDSAEDLMFFEALFHSVSDPSQIYPYYGELSAFCEYLKHQPDMQDEEIIQDFPGYINSWFGQFPLLKDKRIYSQEGKYAGPSLEIHPDYLKQTRLEEENEEQKQTSHKIRTIINIQTNLATEYRRRFMD